MTASAPRITVLLYRAQLLGFISILAPDTRSRLKSVFSAVVCQGVCRLAVVELKRFV